MMSCPPSESVSPAVQRTQFLNGVRQSMAKALAHGIGDGAPTQQLPPVLSASDLNASAAAPGSPSKLNSEILTGRLRSLIFSNASGVGGHTLVRVSSAPSPTSRQSDQVLASRCSPVKIAPRLKESPSVGPVRIAPRLKESPPSGPSISSPPRLLPQTLFYLPAQPSPSPRVRFQRPLKPVVVPSPVCVSTAASCSVRESVGATGSPPAVIDHLSEERRRMVALTQLKLLQRFPAKGSGGAAAGADSPLLVRNYGRQLPRLPSSTAAVAPLWSTVASAVPSGAGVSQQQPQSRHNVKLMPPLTLIVPPSKEPTPAASLGGAAAATSATAASSSATVVTDASATVAAGDVLDAARCASGLLVKRTYNKKQSVKPQSPVDSMRPVYALNQVVTRSIRPVARAAAETSMESPLPAPSVITNGVDLSSVSASSIRMEGNAEAVVTRAGGQASPRGKREEVSPVVSCSGSPGGSSRQQKSATAAVGIGSKRPGRKRLLPVTRDAVLPPPKGKKKFRRGRVRQLYMDEGVVNMLADIKQKQVLGSRMKRGAASRAIALLDSKLSPATGVGRKSAAAVSGKALAESVAAVNGDRTGSSSSPVVAAGVQKRVKTATDKIRERALKLKNKQAAAGVTVSAQVNGVAAKVTVGLKRKQSVSAASPALIAKKTAGSLKQRSGSGVKSAVSGDLGPVVKRRKKSAASGTNSSTCSSPLQSAVRLSPPQLKSLQTKIVPTVVTPSNNSTAMAHISPGTKASRIPSLGVGNKKLIQDNNLNIIEQRLGDDDVRPPADFQPGRISMAASSSSYSTTSPSSVSYLPDSSKAPLPLPTPTPTSPSAQSYDSLQKRLEQATVREAARRLPAPEDRGRSSSRSNQGAVRRREICVKKFDQFQQIILCPVTTRLRAGLNVQVMRELRECLSACGRDPGCRAVLLTSSAGPFCQGLDYSALLGLSPEKRRRAAEQLANELKLFVTAVSEFSKPLIAGVNGDCLGVGVALLPLCDLVYISDKAVLRTVYHRLGTVPEAGATHTLTSLLGHMKSTSVLMAGRCITGCEAVTLGLATGLLWPSTAYEDLIGQTRQLLDNVSQIQALESSKALIRHALRAKLQLAVESECRLLVLQWGGQQFQSRADWLYTDAALPQQKPALHTNN